MDPFRWIPQTRDAYRVLGLILGVIVATIPVASFVWFATRIDPNNASAQGAFMVIVVPGCYSVGIIEGFRRADQLFVRRHHDQ